MKKFTFISLLSLSALSLPADDKVDFVKDIVPIFQKTCIECHGPEKQKGKLRLDQKESVFKRAGDVQAVVPGDLEKSDLYRRVILPKDHDDIMPNKGEPLSKAQTDLIRDWIKQGALWPDSFVIKSTDSPSADEAKAASFKPSPAELKAIAELEGAGISARPIAMNVPWREVNLQLLGSNITDKSVAPLKEIQSLVHINLAGTKITDAALASLSSLTNLTRLHLERTAVSDSGLSHLKPLASLSYLNLYGTEISDAGLQHLKGLTNLQRLYLWQTKVSDAGVDDLKKSLPKLEISRGWELKLASKEPDKAKEELKKEDAKKEEPKKEAEAKKDDAKKEDAKKEEPKKDSPDAKKDEAKKPEAKKEGDKKD